MSSSGGFLGGLFAGRKPPGDISLDLEDDALWIYVECLRCKEQIAVRLRKTDEIQKNYDRGPDQDYAFFIQKEVVGSGRCFNRIHIRLEMDSKFQVTNHEIKGGRLIDRQEYEKNNASVQK